MKDLRNMRVLAVAALLVCGWGLLAPRQSVSAPPAQQMYFTADSLPGWRPSADQQRRALHATNLFFSATDGQRYTEAYGVLADNLRADMSLSTFTDGVRHFNIQAGRAKDRHVVRITWTKNPNAGDGVHATVDFAGQFMNVDRYCGALALYQAAPEVDFLIIRREVNFMDNATAQQLEREGSAEAVEQAWRQLSRHCPPDPASPSPSQD